MGKFVQLSQERSIESKAQTTARVVILGASACWTRALLVCFGAQNVNMLDSKNRDSRFPVSLPTRAITCLP